MTTGFASVILDVDSTLCGIEGIDWLAERRGIEASACVGNPARAIQTTSSRRMAGKRFKRLGG